MYIVSRELNEIIVRYKPIQVVRYVLYTFSLISTIYCLRIGGLYKMLV